MFRKIDKDPKILELNIGIEMDDYILVSDYDLRLLYDYGLYSEKPDVDENIYRTYRELYEKAYNPEIFVYDNYTYIKITKQKYLRHKPRYEYIIAFDLDLNRHFRAAVASKLKLIVLHDGKYYIITPSSL
ncbi:MAG: hypothetical protein QXD03_00945 [Candidatus Anstonellales archaeon]